MSLLRISKEFEFEMAHALYHHDEKCKFIHGHSYKLVITVSGTPVNDIDSSQNGMVMDFKILKKIVQEEIIEHFDHALLINANAPYKNLENIELFDNIVKVPYQPTCENLIIDFAQRIQKKLPGHVALFSLKLNETSTSYVEWVADDK